ncbi:MAG: hypothetical protein PGMFKBFP_02946 [Anaerolineales bacterium]|nr:hypothetical protein [Anaerolineales bacterium]
MFHHVLNDGFHQRIIAHGLHEDGAVVVFGRGGDIQLQGEEAVFLLQAVVNIFDGFEPRQFAVVDVMRFVVDHDQFVNLAHDHAQIHFGFVGLACGTRAEKIIFEIVVVERRGGFVSSVDAMDVGQEQVSRFANDGHVILNVKRHLKIILPVLPFITVIG